MAPDPPFVSVCFHRHLLLLPCPASTQQQLGAEGQQDRETRGADLCPLQKEKSLFLQAQPRHSGLKNPYFCRHNHSTVDGKIPFSAGTTNHATVHVPVDAPSNTAST